MNQQPWTRRLWACFLALQLVGATLAPPLLDAGEDVHGAKVESEHDPAACAPLHDHKACSQLAKTWGLPEPGRAVIRHAPVRVRSTTRATDPLFARAGDSLQPPGRAPPLFSS